ncbi:MAG: type II toxin-antitoxin system RelE/ParE family toxin [Proteobacteria bacterium]|nr:type II toxin-antitoxin system RelE/ParE family toxin [Pseudomonadota bacterium]
MPEYRLSKRAENDIGDIACYTIEQFGIEQARTYRDSMEACFNSIVENPKLGKKIDHIRKGYRCLMHQSHAIFYKVERRDILIIRVLHQAMFAPLHL